jgi:predicted transcriptional regulator
VKDRYLTIRIPSDIDQELRKLAAANTRTLAAQVLHYIKQGVANEKTPAL